MLSTSEQVQYWEGWSGLYRLYAPTQLSLQAKTVPIKAVWHAVSIGPLTHSMVQSPSWEANWFAASQEIPRISRNPNVHYRTHKRPPPVSILGQPNPVHIPTSHLLEIHPNIIHPSMARSPHWSPSLWFPHQDPINLLSSPIRATCPAHTDWKCFKCEIRVDDIKKCHWPFSLSRRWVWLWKEQVIPQRRSLSDYTASRRRIRYPKWLRPFWFEISHTNIVSVCGCVREWVIGGWWSSQGAVIITRQPRNGEVPVRRSSKQRHTLLNIYQASC